MNTNKKHKTTTLWVGTILFVDKKQTLKHLYPKIIIKLPIFTKCILQIHLLYIQHLDAI